MHNFSQYRFKTFLNIPKDISHEILGLFHTCNSYASFLKKKNKKQNYLKKFATITKNDNKHSPACSSTYL